MVVNSDFRPAWWLPGPHLQTIGPRLHPRRDLPSYERERFELPDGDFVDLDWGPGSEDFPLVLILHGLEGSSASPYVRGLVGALCEQGLQAVVMHFRGCSGTPNRLPRSYHSGDTADLACLVRAFKQRWPQRPLSAAGFSLGGNVLLKWLGETGPRNPLVAVAASSVPFELSRATDRLNRGFSRIYQWSLMRDVRASVKRKAGRLPLPFDPDQIDQLHTFRAYDDFVTAPLHGFLDADDYYARCSCRPFLQHIAVPTLIVQSRDDPFMTEEVLPAEAELSSSVTLEVSERGGHMGFVAGTRPWRPQYWLEERLAGFLVDTVRSSQDKSESLPAETALPASEGPVADPESHVTIFYRVVTVLRSIQLPARSTISCQTSASVRPLRLGVLKE